MNRDDGYCHHYAIYCMCVSSCRCGPLLIPTNIGKKIIITNKSNSHNYELCVCAWICIEKFIY